MKKLKKVMWLSLILATSYGLAQEETTTQPQTQETAWTKVTGMFRGPGHLIMVEELPMNTNNKTNKTQVAQNKNKKTETTRQATVENKKSEGDKTAP